jgi:hypothetical protein
VKFVKTTKLQTSRDIASNLRADKPHKIKKNREKRNENIFSYPILDIVVSVAVFKPKGKVFLHDVRTLRCHWLGRI